MKKWMLPLFLVMSFLQASVPPQQQHEELLRSFDQILEKVVALRQLELLRDVDRGVKSKEEIRGYILERLAETYPADKVTLEGRVLKKLGLIPADLDFASFLVELMTEQVAGYYDPFAGTFYIADWIPSQIQEPVMAHELTHALQDQHYDLKPFLEPIEGNDDQTLARSAVVEGDGLAVMLHYILQPMGLDFRTLPSLEQMTAQQSGLLAAQFPVFASAPAYLKESLLFPYTSGAKFLQGYLRTRDWKELDSIYRDLPVSSEQILHPEKYFDDREEPGQVTTEKLRNELSNPESLHRNVLGEFALRTLLEGFVDRETAGAGAAGWNGDQVELVRHAGGESLLLSTSWDSPEDAVEFLDAYRIVLSKKYADDPGAARGGTGREYWSFSDGQRRAVLRKNGPSGVDVIETSPLAAADVR